MTTSCTAHADETASHSTSRRVWCRWSSTRPVNPRRMIFQLTPSRSRESRMSAIRSIFRCGHLHRPGRGGHALVTLTRQLRSMITASTVRRPQRRCG